MPVKTNQSLPDIGWGTGRVQKYPGYKLGSELKVGDIVGESGACITSVSPHETDHRRICVSVEGRMAPWEIWKNGYYLAKEDEKMKRQIIRTKLLNDAKLKGLIQQVQERILEIVSEEADLGKSHWIMDSFIKRVEDGEYALAKYNIKGIRGAVLRVVELSWDNTLGKI